MKKLKLKTAPDRAVGAFSLAPLLFVLGLFGAHSRSLAGGDEWETKAPMPTARLGLAACAVDGKIYAIGGYPAANVSGLSTVEEYDPATDTWATKAPMPTRRRWLSASAVNGKIYAVGGFEAEGTPPLATVEEYDVPTDTWTAKAPMPTARKGFSTAALDGKIYAIGGANVSEQRIASVEMYDPATDTWFPRANMRTARAMLTTAVVNGRIYAMGGPWPGDGGIATVEEYDPDSDTWTTKTSMPTARWAPTARTLDGKIYVMGGGHGTTGLSVVEVYDPLTDLWSVGRDMYYQDSNRGGGFRTPPFRSWGLASAVIDDRIYVMGGASTGPPHPGTDTMIAYTSPTPGIPFANYVRFMPTSPATADLAFEEGPFPSEFGLPALARSPLPGWDTNAFGTISFSDEPPALDMTNYILTVPVHDAATFIARDAMKNELGRLDVLALGTQKADLNADHAVVDETAGTIRVEVGGNLLGGEPSSDFSVVGATGVFATGIHVLSEGFVGYAGGYYLLPLDEDPGTTLQENILNAFGAGQIVGADLRGVIVGNYVPVPTLGGRMIVNGSERVLRLEWESQAGMPYTVQFKETINAPEWTELKSLSGTGEILTEELPVDQPTGFYRVVIPSDEQMP